MCVDLSIRPVQTSGKRAVVVTETIIDAGFSFCSSKLPLYLHSNYIHYDLICLRIAKP